jgi:glucans biosynthesis protein
MRPAQASVLLHFPDAPAGARNPMSHKNNNGHSGRRSDACRLLAALLFAIAAAAHGAASAFGFEDVDMLARERAARPFAKPSFVLPKPLKDLNYDQVRDIRFDPSRARWRAEKLPFELQFFHPAGFFDQPVRVHEIAGNDVREIEFDPADFNYGKNKLDRSQFGKLGYAGFRVHYALNSPAYKDELVVFLGASYFRALGQAQRYGASARGLAVDTAERDGEEFPRFRQFWVERPAPNARQLVILALLESRRVTGAYRFVIRPGAETVTEVQARLYFREPVAKLGIAPVTSMFYFGENQRGPVGDFRPEVHDSDGLSVHTGDGEWIWRPLQNPRSLLVTSFALTDPRGFGLQQRDRNFSSYEDLEARYELRPQRVELNRCPSGERDASSWSRSRRRTNSTTTSSPTGCREVRRRSVAFDFAYRLRWQKELKKSPAAWVVQTRRAMDIRTCPTTWFSTRSSSMVLPCASCRSKRRSRPKSRSAVARGCCWWFTRTRLPGPGGWSCRCGVRPRTSRSSCGHV